MKKVGKNTCLQFFLFFRHGLLLQRRRILQHGQHAKTTHTAHRLRLRPGLPGHAALIDWLKHELNTASLYT